MTRRLLFLIGCMLLVTVIAAAEAPAPDLTGLWTTQKGAVVKCDADSCVMVSSEDKKDAGRIGMTVLKELKANKNGKGAAKLIHPTKDDKYVDVAVKLGETDLVLTLSFWGRSTSATWNRAPAE